jgi:GDP-L-fucose synthase
MPANLYGYGDNYDLNRSHVLPALIRKAHEAKSASDTSIRAWGSGNPKREFLFSDDLADAIVFLMQLLWDKKLAIIEQDQPPIINIGSGEEVSVAELLALICEEVGFKGSILWDNSKPDGTPRKILDNKRLRALGWVAQTSLRDGIKLIYQDFLRRY